MQLSVIWGVNRLQKSDQHSALVTLTSYNKSLLRRAFGASRFESNARPFDTHHWLNMCQAIFQQPPVATAIAGLDKEAQAKITIDVRDALAAYRVGDGLAAPIEAHVAIGHR